MPNGIILPPFSKLEKLRMQTVCYPARPFVVLCAN